MKAEHREAGPVGIKNTMREKGLKGTRETGSKEIRGGGGSALLAQPFVSR